MVHIVRSEPDDGAVVVRAEHWLPALRKYALELVVIIDRVVVVVAFIVETHLAHVVAGAEDPRVAVADVFVRTPCWG